MATTFADAPEEQQLQMQLAFQLCRAVDETPDPVAVLKESISLNAFVEYNVFEQGPLKVLLAMSSDNVKFGQGVKSSMTVQPTVFIAFSNSLPHASHDTPGKSSLGQVLAQQRPCGFAGVEGYQVHSYALAAVDALPMGTILSLLGQGFKLVCTGFKFGGMCAHMFASKLLLQLHQEVQTAKQMGIDLSMSLADNKVTSFAFASPFFATATLARALAALELGAPGCGHTAAASLHTVWRMGDGSPAFFAAASELFTVAVAELEAQEPVTTDEATVGAYQLMRTPQISAIQEWVRHVAENVDSLGRCKAATSSRLLCRPLDLPLLTRVCTYGGMLAPSVEERLAAMRLEEEKNGGASAPRAPAASRSGAGAGASPARAGRRKSVDMPDNSPGSLGAASRRRSVEMADGAAVAAALAPAGPAKAAPEAPQAPRGPRARRRSMELLDPAAAGSGSGAAAAASPTGAAAPRARRASQLMDKALKPPAGVHFPTWKEALTHLQQVMGDGLGERYAPIGQFWLLGAPPAAAPPAKSAPAAAGAGAGAGGPDDLMRVTLTSVDHPKAVQSSASWMSLANSSQMFVRWEAGLEELSKDLMNAFPWVSFRDCLDVHGQPVSRVQLLRKSPNLYPA